MSLLGRIAQRLMQPCDDTATANGWLLVDQTRTTRTYRDPRFIQLGQMRRAGCHHLPVCPDPTECPSIPPEVAAALYGFTDTRPSPVSPR